jgi:ABC-type phosphate transport system ATPase subunit
MIDIYPLINPRTGANFELRRSATIIPKGSEPMSVRAKIRNVFHMPEPIVESIVEKVIYSPWFQFKATNTVLQEKSRSTGCLLFIICSLIKQFASGRR